MKIFKPTVWVRAGENGWIDIKETEFIDISEGMYGEDLYTFEYEGKQYSSTVVRGGSRPG